MRIQYKCAAKTRSEDPPAPPRLLDQVRERARYLHYSLRTEKAYVYWVRMFVRWSGMRHPRDMGEPEVKAFLTMLATQRRVSSSTHNQALSALLFLYREVLGSQLPWMADLQRPSHPRRIPTVLTREEVKALLDNMPGEVALISRLLYGTGMRLMEAIRLRVKDVDFDRNVIVIREAKGNKDRVVMLPRTLAAPLRDQIALARRTWEQDQPPALAAWKCRTPSGPSTRRSATPGDGSGSSHRLPWPQTLVQG